MGRATATPAHGAHSRWPRAVARLRLAFRSPAPAASGGARWIGCFRPAPPAAVKEAKGKRPEVEKEPARGGGEDVWSAQAEAEVAQGGGFPEHLVVMVNGLVGSADDWKFAAEQFVRRMPEKVIVHRSQCNSATQTFDGVDLMGERLANEVLSVVEQRRGVKKISFVAHSLGGLVARYAIGRLYEPNNKTKSSSEKSRDEGERLEGFIAGLEPMNFITFASPHLGSSGNKQILPPAPFLMWPAFPGKKSFGNCTFACWENRKAFIPYRQHRLLVRDEKYPHIVHVDKGATNSNEAEARSDLYDPEEEMIRGLTQVPWERVDVSFQKSSQRLVAHNTIQV
uniref:DUF676 domain-containing protein n=1 Tax=Oryza sativa subsp. japonica TaxID=39947 RepID=Q6ZAC6_ORYSJ|nr:unknown protein [Oryza sativa Japonica Group]BAD09820.1 unknown protein [Oryza sativa Japonica Group]